MLLIFTVIGFLGPVEFKGKTNLSWNATKTTLSSNTEKITERYLQRKLGVELFTGELNILRAAIHFGSRSNLNDQPLILTAKQWKGISLSGE